LAVAHGGPDFAELARLGLEPGALLDFSVSSNPLGTSPLALAALHGVDTAAYPDRQALALRAALAALHGVADDQILIGNGSVELIWLLASVFTAAEDHVVILGPTFGEYQAAVRRQGVEATLVLADEIQGFAPPADLLATRVATLAPRLVFVCNPNNPTGQALRLDHLRIILESLGEGLLVVDEAYIDFAPRVRSALELIQDPRVMVLRSLTKNYGLAGLRLGYAVGATEVVEWLGRSRPPWTVNSLAQVAGLAALDDQNHLAAGQRLAKQARAFLNHGLTRLGLRCIPSCGNFWLVEVSDGRGLRQQLLRRGILVRDCSSFGLPRYIRLAARPLAECQRLIGALTELLPAPNGVEEAAVETEIPG
jgi:histidinol-phosphate aminotransferase